MNKARNIPRLPGQVREPRGRGVLNADPTTVLQVVNGAASAANALAGHVAVCDMLSQQGYIMLGAVRAALARCFDVRFRCCVDRPWHAFLDAHFGIRHLMRLPSSSMSNRDPAETPLFSADSMIAAIVVSGDTTMIGARDLNVIAD